MVSQHKIGLISDIHADLWGLEKSLALFQKHKVSDVFCAGDLVDGGKDGIYVIRTIQQNAIPCVSGNHDRDAFAHQSWIRRSIRQSNKCDHPFLLPSPM
ncbi:MAG: metallophosphoesterase, partial [Chloroflexota bacterium]